MRWGEFADSDVRSYYRATLVGLRYAEAQRSTGRRFGPDADARWAAFKGDLTTADRLDLLIRDGNAEWPEALGARTVFARTAVAEDEPFGAGWAALDGPDAEEVWRAALAAPAPDTVRAALEAAADCWGLRLAPFDAGNIGAAERLLLSGPSAVAAAIEAFAENPDLDWADQVVVVATPPAHRQLAALAGVLLKATKPSRILTERPGDDRRHLSSDDAAPEDRL